MLHFRLLFSNGDRIKGGGFPCLLNALCGGQPYLLCRKSLFGRASFLRCSSVARSIGGARSPDFWTAEVFRASLTWLWLIQNAAGSRYLKRARRTAENFRAVRAALMRL